jgi:hypothetical protein
MLFHCLSSQLLACSVLLFSLPKKHSPFAIYKPRAELPVEEQNRIADRAETKEKKGILFSQSETIVNVELALLAQKLLFFPSFWYETGEQRCSHSFTA